MEEIMTILKRAVWIGLFAALSLLPVSSFAAPNTGSGPTTYDCPGVAKTCGAWGAKGANTCRTCQQAQCKSENGLDVIAGNKTTTECYEGHGAPPATIRPPKVQRTPMVPGGTILRRGVEGEQPDSTMPSPSGGSVEGK
jgi:hypothetical protein